MAEEGDHDSALHQGKYTPWKKLRRAVPVLLMLAALVLVSLGGCLRYAEVEPEAYFAALRASRLPARERPRGDWMMLVHSPDGETRRGVKTPRGHIEEWTKQHDSAAREARAYARGFRHGYDRGLRGLPIRTKGEEVEEAWFGTPSPVPRRPDESKAWWKGANAGWECAQPRR